MKKLKINGYKNIITGKLIFQENIKLKDCSIKAYNYYINGKVYYVVGNELQIIGYTDDYNIIHNLLENCEEKTYNDFWVFCGRK